MDSTKMYTRKHSPPTESDCREGRCGCRCLGCKHEFTFPGKEPSMTEVELETMNTCRSYEFFLKNNHEVCRAKLQER